MPDIPIAGAPRHADRTITDIKDSLAKLVLGNPFPAQPIKRPEISYNYVSFSNIDYLSNLTDTYLLRAFYFQREISYNGKPGYYSKVTTLYHFILTIVRILQIQKREGVITSDGSQFLEYMISIHRVEEWPVDPVIAIILRQITACSPADNLHYRRVIPTTHFPTSNSTLKPEKAYLYGDIRDYITPDFIGLRQLIMRAEIGNSPSCDYDSPYYDMVTSTPATIPPQQGNPIAYINIPIYQLGPNTNRRSQICQMLPGLTMPPINLAYHDPKTVKKAHSLFLQEIQVPHPPEDATIDDLMTLIGLETSSTWLEHLKFFYASRLTMFHDQYTFGEIPVDDDQTILIQMRMQHPELEAWSEYSDFMSKPFEPHSSITKEYYLTEKAKSAPSTPRPPSTLSGALKSKTPPADKDEEEVDPSDYASVKLDVSVTKLVNWINVSEKRQKKFASKSAFPSHMEAEYLTTHDYKQNSPNSAVSFEFLEPTVWENALVWQTYKSPQRVPAFVPGSALSLMTKGPYFDESRHSPLYRADAPHHRSSMLVMEIGKLIKQRPSDRR